MVEGGRVISVDEQRMMESLKGELSRPLSEKARSRRRTAEELKPYIQALLRGLGTGAGQTVLCV